MTIESINLKNYRCFEDIGINFHEKLTVIVGDNGSGKTSILEGAAVSLGTMFVGLDGRGSISINKKDARLKAYQMGESQDIQPQYPVEIMAAGGIDGSTITWKRSLNGENGSTTIKDARAMTDIAKNYYCSELLETFRNEEDPKTPYVGILIWYLQTMVTALK